MHAKQQAVWTACLGCTGDPMATCAEVETRSKRATKRMQMAARADRRLRSCATPSHTKCPGLGCPLLAVPRGSVSWASLSSTSRLGVRSDKFAAGRTCHSFLSAASCLQHLGASNWAVQTWQGAKVWFQLSATYACATLRLVPQQSVPRVRRLLPLPTALPT